MRSLREWCLSKIIDMALETGVHYRYEENKHSESGWAYWPEPGENTVEYRHNAANVSLKSLKNKDGFVVWRVYWFLKTTAREVRFGNELHARIEAETTQAMRSEIMVELYRTGNTEHPLYAVLAEAESVSVLKSLRRQVEKVAVTDGD